MQSTFYEYHNYKVKTNFTTRLTLMIIANAVACLITNPIDVCLTKILTQNPKNIRMEGLEPGQTKKYTGLIQALRTVYKEEGRNKLLLGGIHPRFMFNFFSGTMFLFIYDRFNSYVHSIHE